MSRTELLEQLAEKATRWRRTRVGPNTQFWDSVTDDMIAAIDALDALPATPPGEVVEVAAHVRLSRDGGAYIVSGMGCLNGGWKEPATGATIATITARVPISAIPTVSGTVRLALVKEAADVG